MHDGKQAQFSFHSGTASRAIYPVTKNWIRALGGHRLWSKGDVVYDQAACKLTADVTIEIEDFYNFNKGQKDIFSGLPDDENGRFEVFGWAKSFYSRGSISRTVVVDLACCKDEDCGNASSFDCTCNKCETQCPTNTRSGGRGFTQFTVDLKKTSGTFRLWCEMYRNPDELTIIYEGKQIFSTGGRVSGSRTVSVTYGQAMTTSTTITVQVNAPGFGTVWRLSIDCPP